MTNQNPTPASETAIVEQPTVLRCIIGAAISAAIAAACYSLTVSIAHTFASKPISSDNTAVLNIATAVRTLVVGMSALGTGIFGLAAFGLIGLGIQILFQQLTKGTAPPSSEG